MAKFQTSGMRDGLRGIIDHSEYLEKNCGFPSMILKPILLFIK